jgi:hypothetical protein
MPVASLQGTMLPIVETLRRNNKYTTSSIRDRCSHEDNVKCISVVILPEHNTPLPSLRMLQNTLNTKWMVQDHRAARKRIGALHKAMRVRTIP